ncbi:ATP-binding protein [Nocardia goodfellowii]
MTDSHRPTPLELRFHAEPTRLAEVRRALRQWLTECAVCSEQAHNVLTAADEACANGIEHGCRDKRDGIVQLRAAVDADYLHVTVRDNGRWRTPATHDNNSRGRGLSLMRSMMGRVDVQAGPSGTTVDMYTELSRGSDRSTRGHDGLIAL